MVSDETANLLKDLQQTIEREARPAGTKDERKTIVLSRFPLKNRVWETCKQ